MTLRRSGGGAGEGKAVYSTDPNWVPPCEKCGEPPDRCRCREQPAPAGRGGGEKIARLRIEKKGRGGKTVTIIEGVRESFEETARALKAACGTGGGTEEGRIELQGDLRQRAAAFLEKRGYKVKVS